MAIDITPISPESDWGTEASKLNNNTAKIALELSKLPSRSDLALLDAKKADKSELQAVSSGFNLLGEKPNVTEIKAITTAKYQDTYKAIDTGDYWKYNGANDKPYNANNWVNVGKLFPSASGLFNELLIPVPYTINDGNYQTTRNIYLDGHDICINTNGFVFDLADKRILVERKSTEDPQILRFPIPTNHRAFLVLNIDPSIKLNGNYNIVHLTDGVIEWTEEGFIGITPNQLLLVSTYKGEITGGLFGDLLLIRKEEERAAIDAIRNSLSDNNYQANNVYIERDSNNDVTVCIRKGGFSYSEMTGRFRYLESTPAQASEVWRYKPDTYMQRWGVYLNAKKLIDLGYPTNLVEHHEELLVLGSLGVGYGYIPIIEVYGQARQILPSGFGTKVLLRESKPSTNIIDLNKDSDMAIQALSKTKGTAWGASIKPFTFLHFSDVHAHLDNFLRAIDALNHYDASCAICSGDLVSGQFIHPFDYWLNNWDKAKKPLYHIVGNHDCGESFDVVNCGDHQQVYNKYYKPFVGAWGVPDSGKNYYHIDKATEKVRIIFVYEYDNPLIKSSDTKYLQNRGSKYYSAEQLNWFANTLKSTPSDYAVMVVVHQPISRVFRNSNIPYYTPPENMGASWRQEQIGNPISDIVQHFIDGTIMPSKQYKAKTVGNVDVNFVGADFSSRGKGEFVCYLTGHEHFDMVGFLEEYPKQLSISIDSTLPSGIFYSDMPRNLATKSQDCINMISINRNNKTVNIVRIGANVGYDMQVRTPISIKYVVE